MSSLIPYSHIVSCNSLKLKNFQCSFCMGFCDAFSLFHHGGDMTLKIQILLLFEGAKNAINIVLHMYRMKTVSYYVYLIVQISCIRKHFWSCPYLDFRTLSRCLKDESILII